MRTTCEWSFEQVNILFASVQVPVSAAQRPPPKMAPAILSPQQQLSLRRSAIQRILANATTPSQETRIALLSRLATKSPPGDGIGDEILQHMFKDYHTNQGHELAVTWLFALYKEHTAQTDTTTSNGSIKAETSGAQASVKDESAAEGAPGVTKAESGEGSEGPTVKKSEGDDPAGPSAMDIDGLEGEAPISKPMQTSTTRQ